jgi:oxygen-independent coproporphyrinogen III oxidase
MAGIYIHIPFCKRICHYCDFYRIVADSSLPAFFDSLMTELELRKAYLTGEKIDTIYFGGGTPSILQTDQLSKILTDIRKMHDLSDDCEITLEANPDDLSKAYLKNLKNSTGINRLSIGIQSFADSDLTLMNRRHNRKQAIECVYWAQEAGFNNISIDLIYGLPGMSDELWMRNLENAFELNIQHLSAYHLSIEPKTQFARMIDKGLIKQVPEDESFSQYKILTQMSNQQGFVHYEISNLAREGYYSRHNMNYWLQRKYLGLGPSAHSYNIESRQWNIYSVSKYIDAINTGKNFFETEYLDSTTRFNEYVMVSLRTMWGVSIDNISHDFGEEYASIFRRKALKYQASGYMKCDKNCYSLTPEGWFISDTIITDLLHDN